MITEQDIKNVIEKEVMGFDVNNLRNDQDFTEAGIDSLDHLSILLALEEGYGVKKIPDEFIDDCRSISGILSYLSNE
ncbi:acyl carrier protein [bacterium]|jgi:acyl carrier protein|nr:acyl carrier protein [bacterium]